MAARLKMPVVSTNVFPHIRLPSFYLRIGFDLVTDEALKAREKKEAMEALAVEGVAAWSARQEQEFKDDSRQCISL